MKSEKRPVWPRLNYSINPIKKAVRVSLTLCAVVTSMLLLSGCEKDASQKEANIPEYDVGLADIPTTVLGVEQVAEEIQFDGTVEAVHQATVSAQTAGRIIELHYDVGDYVSKGTVIVRITNTEQAARLDAANSQVNEARVRLEDAKRSFERAQQVFEQKLIAKAEFDRAEAEYNAAVAREKTASASLRQAKENLNYTSVEAPYDGIVVTRHVQLGEAVAPGTPLMTGVSLDKLRVVVDVPQMHIGPLRKHTSARILWDDNNELAATDIRIPPNADTSTHTFRVLVELPPIENASLFPGTLVKVNFVSGVVSRLLVPVDAVVQRGEITGVYVLEKNVEKNKSILSFRYIRLGESHNNKTYSVLSGVKAGDKIVLDPHRATALYKMQQQEQRSAQHTTDEKGDAGDE